MNTKKNLSPNKLRYSTINDNRSKTKSSNMSNSVNYNNYYKRLAMSIDWLRFPLIFLIILLHCYSVVSIEGCEDKYFKYIYPSGLWLGETGVPGFFFISGYLFYISKKNYKQKIATRFHSLLIPYFIWNALILFLYLCAFACGFPLDINNRNIADYKIVDYLRIFWDRGDFDNGNFVPILCPFWYIRNLFIMSLLSPFLYYIIKYGKEVFLLIVTIWWMMTPHNAFISQTILFFSLGAYFAIFKKNPLEITLHYKQLLILIFLCFALTDILCHTMHSTPFNLQVHRLSLIFNLPILLILADWCCIKCIRSKLLVNAAFIVFAVHYPIVVLLRKGCIAIFSGAETTTHIILYYVCVVVSTIASLTVYILLNTFFPKLKNVLSGNR